MEEKPEQTTQEMYGTVFHSCTLNRTNFLCAMKTALDFKLKVGDRVMTEEELYQYANELVDERIQRFSSI